VRFLATRRDLDGRRYGEVFEAPDWAAARRIADLRGWALDGEVHMVIPAGEITRQEADEIVDRLNRAREAH
jgi:hypothetical protein